jgi:hypothetical protein
VAKGGHTPEQDPIRSDELVIPLLYHLLEIVKWERIRRQNHWLDALYNACAAGHYVGARLVEEPKLERKRFSLAELQRRARERNGRR